MNGPIYTIGHSNRSIEAFIGLLVAVPIGLLADIRTVTRSRAHPQFNAQALERSLAQAGIGYVALPELGGLRGKSRTIAPDTNGFWQNASFHHYADYALSETFRTGLDELIRHAREQACVMMCAEAVWWRCHRRIVADHLLARGETVVHLLAPGRAETARLTEGARIHASGSVSYPAKMIRSDDS